MIWVLGATAEVEVSLAEQGYFKDVNWLDRAPTKVYIIGENLLEDFVEEESKTKVSKELGWAGWAVSVSFRHVFMS